MADLPLSGLTLLAEDAADLAVISAALQDAVLKVADIQYEPRARRLTVTFNRYCWEAKRGQRVRSAMQVGGVLKLEARRIVRERGDGVLDLLAVDFEPSELPGGILTLRFAGDGDLRAHVECIDAVLADVSPPWPTPRRPSHDV